MRRLFRIVLCGCVCVCEHVSSYLMERLSNSPPCLSSWSRSASHVMAPRPSTSASSNRALVRSRSCSSEKLMLFSSMAALITCCSSRCCISPSPEHHKKNSIRSVTFEPYWSNIYIYNVILMLLLQTTYLVFVTSVSP